MRGSGPNRWAVYDKRAQQEAQAGDEESRTETCSAGLLGLRCCDSKLSHGGKSVIRFEWRLQTARKIRKQFGFDQLYHLAYTGNTLEEKFDKALLHDIFRRDFITGDQVQQRQDLEDRKNLAPTKYHGALLNPGKLEVVLAVNCWNELENNLGSDEAGALLKLRCNYSERRRFKNKLNQARHASLLPCGLFWGELYTDLALSIFSFDSVAALIDMKAAAEKAERAERAKAKAAKAKLKAEEAETAAQKATVKTEKARAQKAAKTAKAA